MKSEEILLNIKKIKDNLEKNIPDLYIRFSVWKRQVKKIPRTAETTSKKVFLYFNMADKQAYFSPNGHPYVDLFKYYEYYFLAQNLSDYDDAILISCWHVEMKENLNTVEFLGIAPFKVNIDVNLMYYLVINKNKDVISEKISHFYRKMGRVTDGIPKIYSYSEFRKNECYPLNSISENTINLKEAFVKLFGVGLIGGNSYTDFSDHNQICKFLSYKEPEKRNTKKQKIIDDLNNLPIKTPKFTFGRKNSPICIASRVNEEYAVLRWFIPDGKNNPYEVSRLYVSKKNHYFCRKNTYGEYIILNNKLNSKEFDAQKVMINGKDVFKDTKLEYFESIYKELKPIERASALYMLTAYPEFEKFYKGGLSNICQNYLKLLYQNSWKSYIEDIFGKINPKEKTMTKILGFNKHQLELINNCKVSKKNYYSYTIGKTMKDLLNVDDCNYIDNKTFDSFFNFISNHGNYYAYEAVKTTSNIYSIKVCLNMLPTFEAMDGKCVQTEVMTSLGSYKHTSIILQLYIDYINTVRLLQRTKDLRPQFNTPEDIVRMHDDAVAIYNLKKDEIELSKFIKRSAFWKKWEYDKNEKYSVIAPTTPEDLASEGITLHHCVKTYIQRVADGETNIMFIREKNNIEAPFFTVEVGNKGTIEQVHGFGNRNAYTEPGLEDFVKEWAKACKLNTTNYDKVR